MTIDQWLEEMHSAWLERVTNELSNYSGITDSFLEQVSKYDDAFMQAIIRGDPTVLEPVLLDWVEAHARGEWDDRDIAIIPILNIFLLNHVNLAQQCLDSGDALHLVQMLLPAYTHALEFTYRTEIKQKIEHVVEELEQANELVKRIEQSKTDFISVAAHELKTPLTLIEGYSSMLGDCLVSSDEIDTVAWQYLHGIKVGYKRLRDMIEDMIAVSMIDNNILPIHFQPVWIYRLFDIIANEFKVPIAERNISLSIASFPGSEEMTYGDGDRLLQAFRKLVSNAIKYTPDGGSISVAGRLLPGYIEVTVKDTGIGIDPEDQLHIFDKFGRLGNPSLHSSSQTQFKGGGPGLGLSITKGIIEAHGGAIWVESEGYDETKYNGSTFHVLLPLRKKPPDDTASQFVKRIGF